MSSSLSPIASKKFTCTACFADEDGVPMKCHNCYNAVCRECVTAIKESDQRSCGCAFECENCLQGGETNCSICKTDGCQQCILSECHVCEKLPQVPLVCDSCIDTCWTCDKKVCTKHFKTYRIEIEGNDNKTKKRAVQSCTACISRALMHLKHTK